MTDIEIYEVGGCVRDDLLGVKVKDVDYTIVGPASFRDMCNYLTLEGFNIFKEDEPHFTARAHFPTDVKTYAGRNVSRLTADFVLARNESGYSDGRRPDVVTVGTLYQDLARRDFTVNAMAKAADGTIVDPFDGMGDLSKRVLRAVGGAERSFSDDALRVLRALRFALTKGFSVHYDIQYALESDWIAAKVAKISVERRTEELDKMLKFSTFDTLDFLSRLTVDLREAILSGYRLTPTTKRK